MQGESETNHAIAAWIDGSLTPAQRQEFEAHLATCPECQEQAAVLLKAKLPARAEPAPVRTEPPPAPPPKPVRRIWLIVICGVLILAIGYALGSWVWDLSHR